jgi:hypothetical protein
MPYTEFVIPKGFELDTSGLPDLHRTLAAILGVTIDKMKANIVASSASLVGDSPDGPPVLEARMQLMDGRPLSTLETAKKELLSFLAGAVKRAQVCAENSAEPQPSSLVTEVVFVNVVTGAVGKQTLNFDPSN